MSPTDGVRKHLLDIGQAIAELEEFGRGKTLEDLLTDRALQRIFEREFEILGEAMNRLLRADSSLESKITNARRIVGMRNILSHGYDGVDHRILWAAATDHIPVLKSEIAQLIRAWPSTDGS